MNLFRSEEHVTRWLDGRPAGATISVAKICELAHEWWGDRLAADWRPHTRSQNKAILDGLDLVGAFWELA